MGSRDLGVAKVCLVGCGAWGRNLARDFSSLGALASLYDHNHDHAGSLKGELESSGYEGLEIAQSLEQVLEDKSVVGLAIASPEHTHGELVRKGLQAGKHIFVEKPLCFDYSEVGELYQLAKQGGLVLMVGHLLLYHPLLGAVKEILRQKQIGDIRYIYARRLQLGPIRTKTDVIFDLAIHDIAIISDLLDFWDDGIAEIKSVSRINLINDGYGSGKDGKQVSEPKKNKDGQLSSSFGVCDLVSIHFASVKGLSGHINASRLSSFKEQRLVIVGSGGIITFDDTQRDWGKKLELVKFADTKGLQQWNKERNEIEDISREFIESADKRLPLKIECEHFLDCIRLNKEPRTGYYSTEKIHLFLDKVLGFNVSGIGLN